MPIQADPKNIKTQQLYNNDERGAYQSRWWTAEKDKVHENVWSVAMAIRHNNSSRRRQNYYFATLYNDNGNLINEGMQTTSGISSGGTSSMSYQYSRITLNVVQNCIDTASAMIAKEKPKPQFLTDGSKDYSIAEKAKKLTKYVSGIFDDAKIYDIAQLVFRDACLYGTGAIKIYGDENDKIRAEWCFIEEILVDDIDGRKEQPRQLHQLKFVSRDELTALFPDAEEDIASANSSLPGLKISGSASDVIPVLESWHLPSGRKAKDGMHTIVIENKTLLCEPYKKNYYPILFFRWYSQSSGFFGRGIAQEIHKIQSEINKILQTIQQAQELIAVPVWFVENASMIAEDHLLNNEIGRFVEYTGTPPSLATPAAVQPELYQHIQYLEDRAYKIVGISQPNATGTKPPEVKSGVAIREVQDIASGRFEVVGQRWEQFFMDIARVIVDMSKDLKQTVKVKDKSSIMSIDWSEVELDDDNLGIDLFPISALPKTPEGRLETITEYVQNGWISQEQAMELLDFPDLEGYVNLETGTVRLVHKIISDIKEKGEKGYQPPTPYMNLPLALNIAIREIVSAQLQNVDPAHITVLEQFAMDIKDLIQQSQQPPPQAQPPQEPQPQPQPQPPQ